MGVHPEPMEVEEGVNASTSPLYRGAKAGFFVSTTKAIVFVAIAVAACVAVGLIVHFTGDKKVPTPTKPPTEPPTGPPTEPPKPTKPTDIRLPLDLVPELYEVELRPFLEETDAQRFTFDGKLAVHLNVTDETSSITLHINDITIKEETVKVVDDEKKPVKIGKIEKDEDRQFLKVPTKSSLKKGSTYKLTLEYTGNLNDDLVGFYRSSFTTNGTTHYLATTQFQPTDARRAFPCMDEPGIKSKFKIKIKCDKKYGAISNAPRLSDPVDDDIDGNLHVFTFAETPKMSTYLVAFVVSQFHKKEMKSAEKNTTVRVWARPGAIDPKDTVDYSLKSGAKILDHFATFFGEDFPLEKQDMVAVPDFNAGAMENWGLVTYRETALLYDDAESSLSDKQRVCLVVAHELAHQWFGNLVTPKWWNDLWLNEGFANFVEYIGIDLIEPVLNIMDQFVTADLHPTLLADSLTSSHPISQAVNHPDEINELFDAISYGKGASVIRMMDSFLSRAKLQEGLQDYLTTYKYGNTESDDLWKKLSKAVEGTARQINVKKVMDTWTTKMGYPVVTVKKTGKSAKVSQKRFLLDSKSTRSDDDIVYKWEIPFTYTSKSGAQWDSTKLTTEWLSQDGTELSLSGLGDDDWIVGNVEQMGFYRVNYDDDNRKKIVDQLKADHKAIGLKNRAQILDDGFNLARANLIHYKQALDLTTYLVDEEEYVPWAAATSNLGYVGGILSLRKSYGNFMKYMIKIGKPRFDALGTTEGGSDSPLTIYLRSTIYSLMCSSGHEECLKHAKDTLKGWTTSGVSNPVALNLRNQIYCYGIAGGDYSTWEFMFEQYKKATVAAEKKRLLRSLACTKEPWILNRLLQMSLEKKDIRRQDAAYVIQWVASHRIGNPIAWDFIRYRWKDLRAEFGSSMSFARVILAVSKYFSDEWKLQELEDFKDKHPDLGSAKRGFDQAIEKTKANIEWIKNNLDEVDTWLSSNVS